MAKVESLIKAGANVNSKDACYGSPLHHAAGAGEDKIAELLLQNGSDVDALNNLGDTPILVAAVNGKSIDVKDSFPHTQKSIGYSINYVYTS